MKKADFKRFFSPGAIVRKLYDTAKRFPFAVVAIAALATLVFIATRDHDTIDYRYYIFLSVSMFASVATTLALEDRHGRLQLLYRWPQRITTLASGLAVVLMCGVWCFFLPADTYVVNHALAIEIGVIGHTAFFAIFFISFLGRRKDAAWWNFVIRTLSRLMLGAIFAGILFGGLALAIFAVDELFHVDPYSEIYSDLAIVCFMIFAPLYVLAGVPSGEAKYDAELYQNPVLKVLALYILGPVLAVYTLILYVYLFKIIITWELPNGWVSWLVTALAIGGLCVTLLLYPLRMRGGNRVVEFLSRWMGVVFLPLLVLMSVGIARRISDYGFTINRAYIMLLNLWFYGIYIYLFAIRGRRVKWILISAVVVALLSSVGPWSIARVVTPRPAEETVLDLATEQDEYYEWYDSDTAAEVNIPYELGGGRYGRFAHIKWWQGRAEREEYDTTTGIALGEEQDDLIIRLPEEGREFRVPFGQATSEMVVVGKGFAFLVENCEWKHYESRDSIRVTRLDGYLFFN